jgi:hypothetical protein
MQETINIGAGLDATVIQTLMYLAKVIMLFVSIMYTFTFLRGVGQMAGMLARGDGFGFPPKVIIVPTLCWTVFYILTIAPIA